MRICSRSDGFAINRCCSLRQKRISTNRLQLCQLFLRLPPASFRFSTCERTIHKIPCSFGLACRLSLTTRRVPLRQGWDRGQSLARVSLRQQPVLAHCPGGHKGRSHHRVLTTFTIRAIYPLVTNFGISPTEVGLRLSERPFMAGDTQFHPFTPKLTLSLRFSERCFGYTACSNIACFPARPCLCRRRRMNVCFLVSLR
jgi:hypothetical protein